MIEDALESSPSLEQPAGYRPQNTLETSFRAPQQAPTSQTASEVVAILQALLIKADERLAVDSPSSICHLSSLPSNPGFKHSSIGVDKSSDAESMLLKMLLSSFRTLRETAESCPRDPPLPVNESSGPVQHSRVVVPDQYKGLWRLVNTVHGLLLHDESVTRALSSLPDVTRKTLKAEAQYLGNCPSCDLPQPPEICSELPDHAATLVDKNPDLMMAPEQFRHNGDKDADHETGHPITTEHHSLSQGIPFPSISISDRNEHEHPPQDQSSRHAVEATSLRVSTRSNTCQSSILTPSSRSDSMPSLTTVSTTNSPTVRTISDAKENITISSEEDERKRTSSLVSLSRAFSHSLSSCSVSVASFGFRRPKNRFKSNASGSATSENEIADTSYKARKSSLAPQVVTSSEIDPTWLATPVLSLPKTRFFRDRILVEEPEDVHSCRMNQTQNTQRSSPAMEALSKIYPQTVRSRAGSLTGLVSKDTTDASTASSLSPLFSRVRTHVLSLRPSVRISLASNEPDAHVHQSATPHMPFTLHASPITTSAHLPSPTTSSVKSPSMPSSPQVMSTHPSTLSKPLERRPSVSPSSRASPKLPGPSRPSANRRLSRTPPNSLEVTLLSQQLHVKDDRVLPLPPLDPALRAAECASKLLKSTIPCSTCGDHGKDFPRCGKCGEAWCSRQCRLKDLSNAGTKRHVCRPEKLALRQGAGTSESVRAPVLVAV